MDDIYTKETFLQRVNDRFNVIVDTDQAPVEVELVECDSRARQTRPAWMPKQAHPAREDRPFHLVFRGPGEPALSQRIYPMTNEALGDLEIFLVPISDEMEGWRFYEAVFN